MTGRRGSVVVSTSACHADGRGLILTPGALLGVKNLALYITDCVPLCLSEETLLKAVGALYLVSMQGEVKYPTSLHWKCVNLSWTPHSSLYLRTTL